MTPQGMKTIKQIIIEIKGLIAYFYGRQNDKSKTLNDRRRAQHD